MVAGGARCGRDRARGGRLTPFLWGIAAYIAVQFGIGIVVSRRIRTEEDYLVGGRSFGPALTAFTVFATWFGAETCIGAAGAVYAEGLSGGSADPFGYGLCVILAGLVLAVPLWRLRLTTLGDLFRLRYGVAVERLAVILLVPVSVFWAAAQVRAFGQVLSSASGLGLQVTIGLAAVVVIGYTMFGGLLADAWTDVVQGIALSVGLVVLAVVLWRIEGGAPLRALEPGRLNPFVSAGEPIALLELIERWAIPVLGSLTAAELVARMLAARSPAVARNATMIGGAAYVVMGIIPVALGLAGSTLIPGLEHPEQVLPELAQRYLPPVLFVLFAGALVSAILSTVDSALLVASSLVSHNVIVQMVPTLSDAARVRVARAGVAALGACAWGLAVAADRVYDLVSQASAFGSAGVVTVVLFGLFTRIGGRGAGLASLSGGAVAWVWGAYLSDVAHPYLFSLAVAVGAYLLAWLFGSRATLRLEPIPSPMPATAPAAS